MKCIKCGTENEITAKFCRGCGTPIGNTSYLPDLFPKLKLVPKEFATLKSQTVGYIFFVLLNTFLVGSTIAAICWGFYVFGDMYDKEWYYEVWFLEVIFACWIFPIICWLILIKYYKKKSIVKTLRPSFKDLNIDYIQTPQDGLNYLFVVKDYKFGLLCVKNQKIVIPTMYDQLTWKTKDMMLEAKEGNNIFFIDVNNNKHV